MITNRLTLAVIREGNRIRNSEYVNPKGERVDVTEWAHADLFTALTGELGELGNFLKKVRRGDFTLDEAHEDIRKELADILTYLDMLADSLDVDLEIAYIGKWNEVSRRIGVPYRIIGNQVVRID